VQSRAAPHLPSTRLERWAHILSLVQVLTCAAMLVQDLDAPHLEGVCAHCKSERLTQGHRLLQASCSSLSFCLCSCAPYLLPNASCTTFGQLLPFGPIPFFWTTSFHLDLILLQMLGLSCHILPARLLVLHCCNAPHRFVNAIVLCRSGARPTTMW